MAISSLLHYLWSFIYPELSSSQQGKKNCETLVEVDADITANCNTNCNIRKKIENNN